MKLLLDTHLPFPPGINSLYATVRGRRVLSAEGRKFKSDVKTSLAGLKLPNGKPLGFSLELHIPLANINKLDWDGPVKCCQDAVFEASTPRANDAWVREGHVKKVVSYTDEKFCKVKVWEL